MSTRFTPRARAFFSMCAGLAVATLVLTAPVALSAQTVESNAASTPKSAPIRDATPLQTPTPVETPIITAAPLDTPTETLSTPTATVSATPDATPLSVPANTTANAAPIAAPRATPNAEFVSPPTQPTRGVVLRVLTQRLKLPLPLPDAHIVVKKAQRRLELWSGARLVKTYRVALGGNPVGPKSRQHDGRTPEGHFRICTRNATTSAFHIFLGLSYPNAPDAAHGVNSGAISWREYALIQRKLAARSAPLWETRLGGWVGIHGGTGSTFAQRQAQKRGRGDWTAGCVALTDREIEEIYSATQMGTPVWIKP